MFNFQRNIREIRGVQFRLTETSSGECFTGFGVSMQVEPAFPNGSLGTRNLRKKSMKFQTTFPCQGMTRNNFPICREPFLLVPKAERMAHRCEKRKKSVPWLGTLLLALGWPHGK